MQGLEVYNADGSVKFSTINRLARFLLVLNIGKTAGSVSVPGLSTGEPLIIISAHSIYNGNFVPPLPPVASYDQTNEIVYWGKSNWNPGWVMTIGVF